MAGKVNFNPLTRIIEVTSVPVSGVVDLNFQVDVYSDGKEDWLTDDTLNKLKFPMRAVGGDEISDTAALGATFFLQYGWLMRPYSEDHRFRVEGNLYTEPSTASAFLPASGAFSVTIESTVSNLIDVVSADTADIADAVWDAQSAAYQESGSMGETLTNISASSGATPEDIADAVWDEQTSDHQDSGSTGEALTSVSESALTELQVENAVWDAQSGDHQDSGSMGEIISDISASSGATPAEIADAVWNESTSSHTSIGTFGGEVVSSSLDTKYILGLVQHNFRMTNQVYDANGNMTSAEVNIYPSSADATAETNSMNTYYITAVYDGDNRLTDYKMVE